MLVSAQQRPGPRMTAVAVAVEARGATVKAAQSKPEAGQSRKNGESPNPQQENNAAKKASKPQNGNQGKRRDRSQRNEGKQEVVNDEPTMPLTDQADIAETFVTGLAEQFGTSVSFAREDVAEDEIRITATGESIGRMIGQRGVTAGAIDELVRTVLQRHAGRPQWPYPGRYGRYSPAGGRSLRSLVSGRGSAGLWGRPGA